MWRTTVAGYRHALGQLPCIADPDDAQEPTHCLGGANDESDGRRLGISGSRLEHFEPRRVEEGDTAHVDHDWLACAAQDVGHGADEVARDTEIDLAFDDQPTGLGSIVAPETRLVVHVAPRSCRVKQRPSTLKAS